MDYPKGQPKQDQIGNVIKDAIATIEQRCRKPVHISPMTTPQRVKEFLFLKHAELEHEQFSVIFLNTRHYVISFEMMFRGTIDAANVYPREVVKRCLELNAAAVIFAHNHPSGDSTPSQTDHRITNMLRDACSLFNIRALDHLIIGDSFSEIYSMAEKGEI